MAAFIVNTTSDVSDPSDGLLTLREAIEQANTDTAADTITFALGLGTTIPGSSTISLTGGELVLSSDLMIDGDVDGDGELDITVDAQSASRVFRVSSGTTTIYGLAITGGNSSTEFFNKGGGIYVASSATLNLSNSTLSNNAGFSGGALFVDGTATLSNTTIKNNSASRGGGISSDGTLKVSSSTLSGNTAGALGGGIYTRGVATLTNATLAGNTAEVVGGGIFNAGTLSLTNATVTGNSTTGVLPGTAGGGIADTGFGSLSLTNSIVLGNSSETGPEIDGIYTGSQNIVGGSVAEVFASIDPSTGGGLLADHGGPVRTVALKADASNPALDAGNDVAAPATDARGVDRTVDLPGIANNGTSTTDLGALELQQLGPAPTPQTFVVTTTDDELDSTSPEATIDDMGGAGDLSLREAIFLADLNDGVADEIAFDLALNRSVLLSLGELVITDAVTIGGGGVITIDAQGASRVISIRGSEAATTLSGLEITGGYSNNATNASTDRYTGGGIRSEADLTLIDITVSGNSTAGRYSRGGGIYALGNVTLTNTRVSGNSTNGIGAVGGGISLRGGGADDLSALTLFNSIVDGNYTTRGPFSYGGGIFATAAELTLIDSMVTNNSAQGVGGGIYARGCEVTLTGSTVHSNAALSDGGGILVRGGFRPTTIMDSTISENSGRAGGGIAVFAGANCKLINSTISGNRTEGDQGGGGVFNFQGTTTLINSTVSANTATGNARGGGGINNSSGSLEITNSTVSGNSTTDSSAVGGGIYSAFSSTVLLRNSVITGNADSYAGGTSDDFYQASGTGASVTYTGGNIVGGTFSIGGAAQTTDIQTAQIFNRTEEVIDGLGNATGIYGGVLANNGGRVQTIALLADLANPALDAGDDALAPTTDARGELRLVNIEGVTNSDANAVDLGAYEIQRSGTPGPDILQGGAATDTLSAGGGDDHVNGGLGEDSLDGGDGIDTLDFSDAPAVAGFFGVLVDLGAEQTSKISGGVEDIIRNFENVTGSDFSDLIVGDANENTILGGNGRDNIRGEGGDDVIYGGEGFDVVAGGEGADTLSGGAEFADLVSYARIEQNLTFDFTSDFRNPDGSVNTANQSSAPILEDFLANDFEGFAGANDFENTFIADGFAKRLFLAGGQFDDTFSGGANNDSFIAGRGNDVMYGNEGRDGLRGGNGDDDYFGGADGDFFFFEAFDSSAGDDIVHDFEAGLDEIRFVGGGVVSLADLQFSTVNAGGDASLDDTLITYETGPLSSTITVVDATIQEVQDSILF